MKRVKTILIPALVLAVLGAAVWQVWLKEKAEFADIASAYAASQVCSCMFVAERSLESCQGDFTADISAFSFERVSEFETTANQATIERSEIKVSAAFGLIANTAAYQPGLGCTLVE